MKLNRFLHKRAQLVRLNGVKLDGKVAAKGFRASIVGRVGTRTATAPRLAGADGRQLGRPEMRLAIEIGGLRFATKAAAVKHFQAILYRHAIGATTRGTEELFQT